MLHLQEARKVFRKKVQELKDEGQSDRSDLIALVTEYFGEEVGMEEVMDVFANHEVDLALNPIDDSEPSRRRT